MKMDGVATLQHYVPQFLLRNFKKDHAKKDQIYVLDKIRKKIYPSNIRNMAGERYFYNFKNNGEVQTFEKYLSKIESDVKNIIDKIIKNKKLSILNDKERQLISEYICIQYVRTKNHRELTKNLILQVAERFKGMGVTGIDNFLTDGIDEKVKKMSILHMIQLSKKLLPYFQIKKWFLLNSLEHNFCIGDTPVVLRNSIINPMFGDPDLGLASVGVEIYFPISPCICIVAICPSLMKDLERARNFPNYDYPGMTILGAIEKGGFFNANQNYVEGINQLQFFDSEQFLFSKDEKSLKFFHRLTIDKQKVIAGKRLRLY